MKKAILALLLLSTTAVFAQSHTPNTAYGAIDVGTWGGAGSPMALSLSGGYNFAPNLSAEAGYAKMADVTTSVTVPFFGTSTTTVSQYALKGAVVYTHPVAPKVNLQGRVGLAYFSAKATTEGGGLPAMSSSSTSFNLTLGGGAEYVLNQQFRVRAMYELINGGNGILSIGGLMTF